MRKLVNLVLLGTVFVAGKALAIDLPGHVVDPAWLKAHQNQVTILQVSESAKSFATPPEFKNVKGKKVLVRVSGHVPGAHFVDFKQVRVTRKVDGKMVKALIPLKGDFEKRARAWGVNKNSTIVIVPTGTSALNVDEATRLYWQFKYYGQENMAILNGGMAGWLAAGYSAASNPPSSKMGNWVARGGNQALLASYHDVSHAIGHENMQLVDARPQNQYMGVFTKKGEKSGHLPGAKDFSPDLQVTAGGPARFLSAARYESIMKAKGIDPKAPTITYCNTGHLASGAWFISHEIVGNKNSKLYDGSMVEYSLFAGNTVNPAK